MSVLESLDKNTDFASSLLTRIQNAACPVTLAALSKPKPRNVAATEFQEQVRKVLDEHIRLGLVFCYPSGKKQVERYWGKDEKHLLRSAAVEVAETPQPLTKLTTNLGRIVKGVDREFVEKVVRELVGDDQLFVYPAEKKNGAPRFGSSPPPPPLPILQQAKYQKSLNSLVSAAKKLLTSTQTPVIELLDLLRNRLGEDTKFDETPQELTSSRVGENRPTDSKANVIAEIEALILKKLEHSAAVSLADLRENLPRELRGREFDEAVLRLADDQKISVHEDAEPSSFTEDERARYVQDGQHLYTAITKRD